MDTFLKQNADPDKLHIEDFDQVSYVKSRIKQNWDQMRIGKPHYACDQ